MLDIDYSICFNSNEQNRIKLLADKWNCYKIDVIDYINKSQQKLDSVIYKQDTAKNEIIRIIGQWINGDMNGYCLGFEGPPGVGKTTFAKEGLSQCLEENGIS